MAEKPNWPDSEFPWALRTEEKAEQERAEEEERLRWIEKFLDRESDEEDDEEGVYRGTVDDEEEVLPSSVWGMVYDDEDDRPVPYRAGRGKMVPLRGDPGLDAKRESKHRRSRIYNASTGIPKVIVLKCKTAIISISVQNNMVT